jgi:hypothetical protein
MSKRKLSFKEREEKGEKEKLKKQKKETEKEKLAHNISNTKTGSEIVEQKETLPPTDWSVIPSVDWENVKLSPLEKNFLNQNTDISESDFDSIRKSLDIEISILQGPNEVLFIHFAPFFLSF